MRGSGGSQAALHLAPGARVAPCRRQRVLVKSLDWTGAPAETPLRAAFAGGRTYLRLSARNPLLKRLWNDPRVSVTPPHGRAAVQVEARILAPHEQGVAEQAFASASALSSCLLCGLSAIRALDLMYVELR